MNKTDDKNRKKCSENIKRLNEDGWRLNQNEQGVIFWCNIYDENYNESNLKIKYTHYKSIESELN